MSEADTTTKPRHRGLLITFTALLTILVAILVMLPYAINYGITQWIKDHGAEQVSVENVDFNPFTATLHLDNLKVTNQAVDTLTLPKLDLQLSWWPLWQKQVVITGLSLSGVEIQLIQDSKGQQLQIGGMKFSTLPEEKQDNDTPWVVRLNRISLNESSLQYQGPKLSSLFTIEQLTLAGFATDNVEQAADLELHGSMDKASVIVDGKITPLSESPSFKGKINIAALSLKPFAKLAKPHLEQLEGTFTMGGILSLLNHPKSGLEVTHEGRFSLKDYQVADQDNQISGDNISWKGALEIKAEAISLKGDLSTGDIQYRIENQDTSYHHTELNWQGSLDLKPASDNQQITTTGHLTLHNPEATQKENQLQARQVDLSLDKTTIIIAGNKQQADLSGKFDLLGLTISTPAEEVLNESLSWEGKTNFNRVDEETTITTEGSLQSGPLELKLNSGAAGIRYSTIEWNGLLAVTQEKENNLIKPAGNLTIKDLQATDIKGGLQLISIDSATASQIASGENGTIKADQIAISSLALGKSLSNDNASGKAMLTMAGLQLRQPSYSEVQGINIAHIESKDVRHQLVRLPDNKWNIDRLADAAKQFAGNEQDEPKQADKPLPIVIDKITLTGDSLLTFEDQTTDPIYLTQFKPEQLILAGLDSNQPRKTGSLNLKGILGESSTVNLGGDVAFFAPKPAFQLDGRIEGLELPPLSAYTIPLMGYRLQSGKANSDIKISAKDGKIDGSSDLTINQLEVEPISAEKMKALQTQLSIPLDTALGMLKDKNNTIKLNLPIKGDADSINIDPSDAINQAIGRAMKKGAKTYLATALFPFGTLLTLVELAGDAAAKVQLDPILFDAGSSQLKSDQHAYLGKVAQLLNDRPEIHIRLCGTAVAADLQVLQQQAEKQLKEKNASEKAKEDTKDKEADASPTPPTAPIAITDEQLQQLAAERAKSIERHLSETHNIKGDRLITCQPRIENEEGKEKAQARADLLI